jgi:hypothetical protein
LPLTMELLNQGFLVIKLKSPLLLSAPWLGWSLWNIRVTDDYGFVMFVVITITSFFTLSWLIDGCLIRVSGRVPQVDQELLIFPKHMNPS